MRDLVFILPFALILTNCSTKYQAEINEIDSLIVQLDSAKSVLLSVDEDKMKEKVTSCNERMDILRSTFDTLTKDEAIEIDRYANYCKAYRKWYEKMEVLQENIEVVPAQLKNLRNDLSKNLIESEKASEYITTERDAAISLIQTIGQMHSGLNGIKEQFKEYDQKVLHLIQKRESTQSKQVEA